MTAVPFAVVKKFGDDQGGKLAALVAYYGFLSVFPLLLVLVSVLGFVLADRPDLQQDLLDTAFAQFPVLGTDLRDNVGEISGNGLALIVGLLGALWAGLGAMSACQDAGNEAWGIQVSQRPRSSRTASDRWPGSWCSARCSWPPPPWAASAPPSATSVSACGWP